jgi:DNA-binding winged helix-turn-helix (wHTH) protein
MRDATQSKIVCFGPFQLDLAAGELYAESHRMRLQEQPFQVLVMLVERPGEVLTREHIRGKLWPNGTVVEFDHSINTAVKKLRVALGDSAEAPRYVETVGRRGYRFMAPVERAGGIRAGSELTKTAGLAGRAENGLAKWSRKAAGIAVGGTIALLLMAEAGFWFTKNQPHSLPSVPDLKQRQLTTNSSENTVSGGSISPDGRYLAYADLKGIHIKLIETGETRNVPQPDNLKGIQVNWGIATNWVGDGSSFIANANVAGKSPSIWAIPAMAEHRASYVMMLTRGLFLGTIHGWHLPLSRREFSIGKCGG